MNTNYLTNLSHSLIAAFLTVSLIASAFFILEPKLGQAADSTPFTIKQVVTGEISFLVQPTNVSMTGNLNGVTGGTANGTTTTVVTTNNSNGYTMSIDFEDNVGGSAMYGDGTGSDAIHDYAASGTEPTYGFITSSSSAVFAYTVSASSSSDLDQSFKNNGSNLCNSGSTFTAGACWMEPKNTGFQIIDRSTSATTGATTTISFRVYIPNAPSPSVVTDTYTATATLTALNK